ncbi:adhesion G protein-coupled receptor B1-like [Argopecten irradians]|uniref:adhesion G protein-coupled receptor B1-like n=1 Tax=Argopecten irradians TaxID=31199 RepID=UPI00371F6BE9
MLNEYDVNIYKFMIIFTGVGAIISEARAKTFIQRSKRSAYDECRRGCTFLELDEVPGWEEKMEFMKNVKCSFYNCGPTGYCIATNANYVHSDFLEVQCVINGAWGQWSDWATCPVTCGGGTKIRTRSCDSPSPSNGGSYCPDPGTSSDWTTCGKIPCPIDGVWGDWNPWSKCSVTCELGTKTRSRECDSPAPEHDGKPCPEDAFSADECNLRPCPVDGAWSSWRSWSACAPVNSGVLRSRCRKCTDPVPQYGGAFCPDKPLDSEQCDIPLDTFKPKCRCRQARMPVVRNMSVAEIAAAIEELKEELTVDKTTTAVAVRKKISVSDSRTSSTIIGVLLGSIMMSIPLLFISAIDLVNVYQYWLGRTKVRPAPSAFNSIPGSRRTSTV